MKLNDKKSGTREQSFVQSSSSTFSLLHIISGLENLKAPTIMEHLSDISTH